MTCIVFLLGESLFFYHYVEAKPSINSLVLMSYYGVVLLLLGYQADEAHIIKQYKAIVNRCSSLFFVPLT
jgi:hypothetical protein